MIFQFFAAFALLFALTLSTPVFQLNGYSDPRPICSTGEGALLEDCMQAFFQMDTTPPGSCNTFITRSYEVAIWRTCRIRTWDPAFAHCIDKTNIYIAARRIMSTCWRGSGTRVAGKWSFPGTRGERGVEILSVPNTRR
ncbi:unnamed protein product [Tuber aestivum]|uniref:Extracellular membrane protein CFEM domain-containing protein n=1 Tax=Tuber aestivum TaxID=59557 RepID=A0A292Q5G8_9PEZI|nr:unnamed protein product [Tuber aestivum]